jgi:Skp family chaperone for outer membrane proteins
VKKLILIATGFVFLAGGSYFLANTSAAPQAPADEVPHRVGLIDMNYVFQNYDKLKELAEEHKAKLMAEEAKFKAKAAKIQELQSELRELTEGSPEFTARETKLTRMASEFKTERDMVSMEIKKDEARLTHQVYLEIHDAVEKFCEKFKFTVVIKFSRIDLSSTDPARVNQLMSQPVMYHRKRDDLTDGVVKYLNEKYHQSAGGEMKPVTESKPPKGETTPPAEVRKPKKDNNIKGAGGTTKD